MARIWEITDDNKTDAAADRIRDAISLIDWQMNGGDSLNNAWAALNSALELLGHKPINTESEVQAWRYSA